MKAAQSEYPILLTRQYLAPTLSRRFPSCHVNKPEKIDDDLFLVNGTLVPDSTFKNASKNYAGKDLVALKGGQVVFAKIKEAVAKEIIETGMEPLKENFKEKLSKFGVTKIELSEAKLIGFPWELVDLNSNLIEEELPNLAKYGSTGTIDDKAIIYGDRSKIHVGSKSFVEGCVVLDAKAGPIYIGDNSYIQAPSRISGPTYIGNSTTIFGAKLGGCSIGDVCRIGGEVEQTIVQGHSNKRHTGFIGHAYIGEWVNLGAGTVNSNLKNTYGDVEVVLGGRKIETNRSFIGCFIGDHVKTSIGTQIFTGKIVGLCSHLMGLVSKNVPPFTIHGKSIGIGSVELNLESAIRTQARMFARRGVEQKSENVELLKFLFKETSVERRKAGVRRKKLKL